MDVEDTQASEKEVKDLVSEGGLLEVQSPCQEREDEVMQAVSDIDECQEEPAESQVPAEVGSTSSDPPSVPLLLSIEEIQVDMEAGNISLVSVRCIWTFFTATQI